MCIRDRLLVPFFETNADIVYGSRFIGSTKHEKESAAHRLANHFLTWLGNVVNGVNLGLTFRNQFRALADSHGGDMNQTIASWVSDAGFDE